MNHTVAAIELYVGMQLWPSLEGADHSLALC